MYFQQREQRADEIGPVMTENPFRESISTFRIPLLHQFKIMNKKEYFYYSDMNNQRPGRILFLFRFRALTDMKFSFD